MLETFRKMTLRRKVFIIALAPFVCYLALSSVSLWSEKEKYEAAILQQKLHTALNSGTALRAALAEERRSLAQIGEAENRDEQRQTTDNRVLEFRNATLQLPNLLAGSDTLQQLLQELEQLQDEETRLNPQPSAYTTTIEQISSIFDELGVYVDSSLSREYQSEARLALAFENAERLLLELKGVLDEDMPIETDQFQQLLTLRAGITNNLALRSFRFQPELVENLESLVNSEHWAQLTEIFQTVLVLSSEGGYGFTADEAVEATDLLVEDISRMQSVAYSRYEDNVKLKIEEAMLNLVSTLIQVTLITLLLTFFVMKATSVMNRQFLGRVNESFENAKRASHSSRSLTDSSKSLAAAAQQSAAAVQESASSTTEIGSMIDSTIQYASQARQSAREIGEEIKQAGAVIDDLVVSMNEISQSKKRLEEIQEVFDNIAKETGVINSIVFKTQLLAVNAAIESARAGAHGKGFAVVADEVSKLALLSGSSSEQISSLLEQSTRRVAMIRDEIQRAVEHGEEVSQGVVSRFASIESSVSVIEESVTHTGEAAQEQKKGIEQLQQAIFQIDESTHDNATEAQSIEDQASRLLGDSQATIQSANGLKNLIVLPSTSPSTEARPTPVAAEDQEFLSQKAKKKAL